MSARAKKELGFAHEAFETEASSYERGRPSYPADAVSWLLSHFDAGARSTIVDLAAGTGKLTRLLATTGAHTVAVEPVDGMLAQLVCAVPTAVAVAGAAEALPLADGCANAVTVAQAFHWFRTDAVFPELHRVLVPGGGVGLIWNDADTSVPWVADLSALSPRRSGTLLRRGRKAFSSRSVARRRSGSSWPSRCREAFASTELFGPVEHRQFRHSEPMEAGAIVDWVRSFSRFSRWSREEQADVMRQTRQLTERLPSPVSFPYRTDVFWSTRLEQ